MTEIEPLRRVTALNQLLAQHQWMDFDIGVCTPYRLTLDCGIDLSIGPSIEIRFESIFYVSLLSTWRTDTSRPIVQLLEGAAAREINLKYRIEVGNHLFTFDPEDLEDDVRCVVAAKEISWRMIEQRQ